MLQSFIVLDDFIPGIDQLRNVGLQQSYPPAPEGVYYPGRNSSQPIEVKGLHQAIEHVVGEELVPTKGGSCNRFRVTLAEEDQFTVHTDACHWTGILYLNPPDQCQGGTTFYRHKETGLDRPPNSDEEISRSGYSTPDEFLENVTIPNASNRDAWEMSMQIPMKYNRLVLFRPWHFHDAGKAFGTDLQSGRLIYMMFFYSKAELDRRGGLPAHLLPT